MPWPSENGSPARLKKVNRSRKWLIAGLPSLCRPCRDRRRHRGGGRPALDVVEQTAAAGVEAPGDQQATHVEDEEGPKRGLHAAGEFDGRAVGLRDEERAERRDRRGEASDGGRLLLGLADARIE